MKRRPQQGGSGRLRESLRVLPVTLLGTALALPALAAEPEPDAQDIDKPLSFSGSVAAGAEYNSNLSVSQLESSSGQSDVAATLDVTADLSWHPTSRFTFDSGYSFTGSRYDDIDTYDLDMHLLYGDASYDFGVVTIGANAYYANADLGGDSFLELNQYSLYAGKLFGQNWYVRGALNQSDKEFDLFSGRDADNDGVSAELYRFFNAGRSNVVLSYAIEDEHTRDTPFRHSADTIRLRLNHRFSLAGRDSRMQLGYRFQDREYDYNTPSINAPRDDSQNVVDARLEVNVVENFALIGRVEHGQYDSRLPSADYEDNRVAFSARFSF